MRLVIVSIAAAFALVGCQPDPGSAKQLAGLQAKVEANPGDAEALSRISEIVRSGDVVSRSSAISHLGSIAQHHRELVPKILPVILTALAEGDEWDKRTAAARLKNLAGPDTTGAIPALVEALRYSNEDIGWFAAEGLGNYGEKASEASKPLQAVMMATWNNPDNPMAVDAAEALGKLNQKESAEMLRKCVQEGYPKAKLAAIESLYLLGELDPQSKKVFLELLSDKDRQVVYAAKMLLERHGNVLVP